MNMLAQLGWPRCGLAAACRAARYAIIAGSLILACWCTPPAFAQQGRMHDAFESAMRTSQAPTYRRTNQPIASRPRTISPTARQAWQPQGAPRPGQLQWGVRLAQAEAPADEAPVDQVPVTPPPMTQGPMSPAIEAPQQVAQGPVVPPPPTTEALPTPTVHGTIPLEGSPTAEAVEMSQDENGMITLIVRNASLSQVLAMFAQRLGLNIVAANDIDAMISITLEKVPPEEALTAILSVANYTWVERNNIILVTSLTDAASVAPEVQDRQIQVFELDYASATEVNTAVQTFLSPVGKVSISESDPTNNRKTRELVVVEDLPASLARIAAYIEQIDCPPRQVQIEAHVLQVKLTDETSCGVDLNALFRIAGSPANIYSIPSLASVENGVFTPPQSVASPAAIATFSGSDLGAVIEALQKTTDSKTLGSPKLLVVNGQEAHIQVGQTIYYSTTTTTQTSSQQGAQPIDTGVQLRLTPHISQDGRVLLHVEPEVSNATGERPSEDLPPNIAKIELHSDVMLRDGEGMIIGGLIDERDATNQQKLPYLGDLKGIGWLFRKSTVNKERSEIIFALVPRIQPYDPEWQAYEQGELARTGVPLLHGRLDRTYRPWDTVLPDGKRVTKPLVPRWHWSGSPTPDYPGTPGYVVPPYPLPQQNFYGPCEEGEVPADAAPEAHPFLSDEVIPAPQAGAQGRQQR